MSAHRTWHRILQRSDAPETSLGSGDLCKRKAGSNPNCWFCLIQVRLRESCHPTGQMDEKVGTHLILLEEIIIPQGKEPPESWECLGLENLYLLSHWTLMWVCGNGCRGKSSQCPDLFTHVKFLLLSSDRYTEGGINILIVFDVPAHAVFSTWNGFIPTCLTA